MTFSKEHILYFLLIFLQMDLMTIQQIVHSFWVPTIVTPSLSQPQAPSPTEVCSAFPLSGCGLPPHRCITPRMALAVCYIHNTLNLYTTQMYNLM